MVPLSVACVIPLLLTQSSAGSFESGVFARGVLVSPEARQNLQAICVAIEAAKQKIRNLACDINYSSEFWHTNEKRVKSRSFTGRLIWSNDKVSYRMVDAADGKLVGAVYRDDTQYLRAYILPDSKYTFSREGRLANLDRVFLDDAVTFSLADPNVHFGGTVLHELLHNSRIAKADCSQEGDILTVTASSVDDIPLHLTFSATNDLLPQSSKYYYRGKEAIQLGIEEQYEWARVGGIWAMTRCVRVEHAHTEGIVRQLPTEAKFTNITVNQQMTAKEGGIAWLGIPEETLGVDLATRPRRSLIYRKGKIERTDGLDVGKAVPAKSEEIIVNREKEAAAAAQNERVRYYLLVFGSIGGILAIVFGFFGWTMLRARNGAQ